MTAIIVLAFGIVIGSGAIDAVSLITPGYHGSGRDAVVQDFGRSRIGPTFPYDGQQVYLAARELPNLRAASRLVDSPRYRLLRVLLPLLASPGRRGNSIILLLLFWNAVGIGLAVAGLTALAEAHGRRSGIGFWAAAPLLLSLLISTTEPLAFGLGFAGLALADRRRWLGAALLLSLGALTRETALTFAVGAAVSAWMAGAHRKALIVALVPTATLAVWWLVVRSVAGGGPGAPLALLGFVHLGRHLTVPNVAVALLAGGLGIAAILCWRDVTAAWATAAGFLGWFAVYGPDTYDWWALCRVTAPLFVLGVAGLLAPRQEELALAGGMPPPGVAL